MGDPRLKGGSDGGKRVWTFADCRFDERNWTLTVNGQRVPIESKPLEILRALLVQPGQVVSKADLLDQIWPDISVVEASLPTAIHKLRAALGDDHDTVPLIETVPKIGYRFSGPVTVAGRDPASVATPDEATTSPWRRSGRLAMIGVVVILMFAGLVAAFWPSERVVAHSAHAQPTPGDVNKALRTLDIDKVNTMVDGGWNVNMPLNYTGDTALNALINMCEWDPGHDRRKMLLVARTLVEAGTKLDQRNIFGDTPYSIAKAPRYCGPDHPVTVMLRRLCYNGGGATSLGDRCLASYEVVRRNGARQPEPKKGAAVSRSAP